MKGLVQLVAGLVVLVGTLYLLTYPSWLGAMLVLVKGGIVAFGILISVILLVLGFNEIEF